MNSNFSYGKKEIETTNFDVIVVGGGHAGAEAAHVCASGGMRTLLITMNLDTIGQMSCNPAIGGIAKGHIVREIDAMGGIMGRIIDTTGIHFKMLNRSKGPAVWAPRAQAEKRSYQNHVKWELESTHNLSFRQDTCEKLLLENDRVSGIVTGRGHEIAAPYIILTTGTFLSGLIHIGEFQTKAGRIAEQSSIGLSGSLAEIGFSLGRLKTGTPPRILKRTIDFSELEEQKPDEIPQPFSFQTESISQKQISCHITYTNQATHSIIRENLSRSPMYSGQIKSSGPRYCPSIEDKIVKFPDKDRHQIFIEPEGILTGEIYLNGVSTSLPEEIQWKIIRSCRGLEEAQIIRPGYAVEYDFVDPRELYPDLQTKKVRGLFFAGQINGTTGYEEAAAQGFMAGANVLLSFQKREPFVLGRGEAYTGVLIDDLVYKGVEDPYRMFTSRAEHRLLLRQDNADMRLMKYGLELGLIKSETVDRMKDRYAKIEKVRKQFMSTSAKPSAEFTELLKLKNIADSFSFGKDMAALLRRTDIDIEDCRPFIPDLNTLTSEEEKVLEMEIKYDGYVKREEERIERRSRFTHISIPDDFDFASVPGLKYEARDKLKRLAPRNLGQASRISGVDPTDIDLLYFRIKQLEKTGVDAGP